MSTATSAESAGYNVIRIVSNVIYVVFGFAVIVLAFAFALLIFGADPDAGFAHFIYGSAARFIDPFQGMIEPTSLGNGGVIYWSSLFAIAAYLVLISVVATVSAWARRGAGRARREASKEASKGGPTKEGS